MWLHSGKGRHLLGAHDVNYNWLWSIARVRGVSASIIPFGLGLWILYHWRALFLTRSWEELHRSVGGDIRWIAWPILIGGVCGIAGLLLRARFLSVASCLICCVWFAWMLTYLGYSNFTDAPNVGMWFALYGFLEYVYRFVLLALPPRQGEEYGAGW